MAWSLDTDTLVADARRALLADRIDADEFEVALDHIIAGGVGCRRFPYLGVYRPIGEDEPELRGEDR